MKLLKCWWHARTLQGNDSQKKQNAIRSLGEINSQYSADILVKFLSDKDAKLRELSALALGNLSPSFLDREKDNPLIGVLKDENVNVRKAAVQSLYLPDIDDRIEKLVEIADDPSPIVREAIVKTLGKSMSGIQFCVLEEMKNDPAQNVRFAASEMLSLFPDPRRRILDILMILSSSINKDNFQPDDVLSTINFGIGIGNLVNPIVSTPSVMDVINSTYPLKKTSPNNDLIRQSLKSHDIKSKLAGIVAAGFCWSVSSVYSKLEIPEVESLMYEMLQYEGNYTVIGFVVWALGHNKNAYDILIKEVNHSSAFVRGEVILALLNFRKTESIQYIINALEDSNFYVRRSAIQAIGKKRIPINIDIFKNTLKDISPFVRGAAVESLGFIGKDNGIQSSDEMPKENDSFINDPDRIKYCIELLRSVVEDPSLIVRKKIITALELIKNKEAVAVLKILGNDSDSDIRKSALNALDES